MSALILELFMNGLVALLLMLTIAYCWVLNKRIKVLQDSRSELAELLRHFDESTQRASASVLTLQGTSKKLTDQINERVEKANFMADDLAFLIEKAGKLADKLEAGLADGRKKQVAAQPQPGSVRPTMAPVRPMPMPVPSAQRMAIEDEAVKKPTPAKPKLEAFTDSAKSDIRAGARETLSAITSVKAKTAASLEAVLERIASRGQAEGTPREEENPAAAIAGARQREQAEELLALVRANRQA